MSDPIARDYAGTIPERARRQRRSFLVSRRYQLRASLLAAATVLVLLILLNLLMFAASSARTERALAEAPELAAQLRAQDRLALYLVMLASVVFLVGVFVIGVLESHRTAGAAYNIAARLKRIERGRYATRVTLRRGDHLAELQNAVNDMARGLQERTWHEVESLMRIADAAESATDAGERMRVAAELRELAERMSDGSDHDPDD